MMKYVLMTGGTSMTGYELSRCFLRNSGNLIVTLSNIKNLEEKKKLEREFHKKVLIFEQDLSKIGGAKNLYEKIKSKNIEVDIIVNNTGFELTGSTVEIDFDEKLIILNVISLVELSKLFIVDLH